MPHLRHKHKHHNKKNAKRQAKANAAEAEREKGGGSITIDGNAYAMSQATCLVAKVRDGIDGPYQIASAKHAYHRGSGWETHLQLKLPGKGTGKDSRKSTSAGRKT